MSDVPRVSSEEVRTVLDPDNPLLDRFQKALKEHLLRQIEHLKSEIFDYEGGAKKNNVQREELGVLIYDEQQVAASQQKLLDGYISRIDDITAAREELQNVVQEQKAVYRTARDRLMEAESRELELTNEVDSVNLLIYQMSQWESTLESDITAKKRALEKGRKDKLKLIEEKRNQDALIYNLTTRIWKLEQELGTMDLQLQVKEREREELAQTVALGNTNIDAIESEQRALMHSWNSVIIAIGNRDKVLTCIGGEYMKWDEKLKTIISEISQVKKLAQKEMRQNEQWTVIKDRFVKDNIRCKAKVEAKMEKTKQLQKRMIDMQRIHDQTETDIDKISNEAQGTIAELNRICREFESLCNEKVAIEEKIMMELEDQVVSNKSLCGLKRVLTQLKKKNRETEIQVATVENKTSYVLSQIQSQKFVNNESQKYYMELCDQIADLERQLDHQLDEARKLGFVVGGRQRELDLLAMKLQRILDKPSDEYASPLNMKISALERNIEEIQEENKKMQQYWLREQTNLLRISHERQEQIQTNNLLRKQILILEQKNLRVTEELDQQINFLDKVIRQIVQLQNKLTSLSDTFWKKRGSQITMTKDNDVLRQDYVFKLKDAELECLQLEDDITGIEEDKVNLSKELIDLNREALFWERKFISVKETKSTLSEERSKGGEIGGMKCEIHRMEVRYSQLKKVQDLLIHDLEHCVLRRDAIVTGAQARERRTKGGLEKTRINFTRKLDDLKNKAKQMENEISRLSKQLDEMKKQELQIEDEIRSKDDLLKETALQSGEVLLKLEEAVTQRQMCFEWLLLQQRKLNIYNDVNSGRKPMITIRNQQTLIQEYNKERDLNGRLTQIIENLQLDFPNYSHQWERLLNSLKVPMLLSLSQ